MLHKVVMDAWDYYLLKDIQLPKENLLLFRSSVLIKFEILPRNKPIGATKDTKSDK